MAKNLKQIWYRQSIPKILKAIYKNPPPASYRMGKVGSLPTELQNRQGSPPSPALLNTAQGILARAINQEKAIRGRQTGKAEGRSCLQTHDANTADYWNS